MPSSVPSSGTPHRTPRRMLARDRPSFQLLPLDDNSVGQIFLCFTSSSSVVVTRRGFDARKLYGERCTGFIGDLVLCEVEGERSVVDIRVIWVFTEVIRFSAEHTPVHVV